MQMAQTIAQRSHDDRYQVGAVVVTEDNTQVLSVGYNGNYSGGPDCAESDEPGQSGLLHAEINALLKLDYNNPKRKILYVTMSPCVMCAKAIVNAGVQEVVYDDLYRDTCGLQVLAHAHVKVRQAENTKIKSAKDT